MSRVLACAFVVLSVCCGGVGWAQERPALGPAQGPLYTAAVQAREAGEHSKAIEILNGMVRLGEVDVVFVELARNHVALGQCVEARSAFDAVGEAARVDVLSDDELEGALSGLRGELALECEGQADAAELYSLGVSYFEQRMWMKAARAFELALAQDANATLAYNVGRSYEYAGELELAMKYYRQALGMSPDEESKARMERSLERLVNLAGSLETSEQQAGLLEVNSSPSEAVVKINDKVVGMTPLREAYAPGTYVMTIEAPGYREVRRTVKLQSGREVVVDAKLESSGRPWTWVTLSSAVLLAGGGVTMGVLAQRELDEASEAEAKRDEGFDEIVKRGRGFAQGSMILYGLAGAALIGSGVFYVLESPDEDEVSPGATLRPIVAPDFIGVGGTF